MLALVLLPPDPVDDAIGLFHGWRDRNPVHEYRIEYRSGTSPKVDSLMRMDWNRKWTYFKTNSETFGNYELSYTDRGWLDLEHNDKQFDELPMRPEYGMRPSRLSGAIEGPFPSFIFSGTLRNLLPTQLKPTRNDNAMFNGAKSIELTATRGTSKDAEEYRAKVNIAPDGTLQRVHFYNRAPMSPVVDREWVFQSSTPIAADDSLFLATLPADYAPYSVDDAGMPIVAGESAKLAGWVQQGTGKALAEEVAGKLSVIAIFSPEDPLSQEGIKALEVVGRAGVPVFALSDTGQPFAGAPYYNSQPNGMDELNPPSTPFFYLIDKNGKVQALWMGVEQGKADVRAEEIIAESKRKVGE